MSLRLKVLVSAVVATSMFALVATFFLYPLTLDWPSVMFWIAASIAASAAPVQLPRGTRISVSGSPILAAAFLGGPIAAGLVGAFGSTEWRELRGRVPWYGTLYNHAALTLPAIAGAVVFEATASALTGTSAFSPSPGTLIAALAAGVVYLGINSMLTSAAVAVRDGLAFRSVIQGDWAIAAVSTVALAPLAWLMAVVSISVGQWAVILFGLPLATTRSAYKRVVEIRDMFTQTISSLSSAVDAKDHYTAGHSKRVQEISVVIGRQLRCSEAELEALEWGGLLHDIGKIGVPDAVLLKPDRLTREERVIMNMHPVKGEEIIRPVAASGAGAADHPPPPRVVQRLWLSRSPGR